MHTYTCTVLKDHGANNFSMQKRQSGWDYTGMFVYTYMYANVRLVWNRRVRIARLAQRFVTCAHTDIHTNVLVKESFDSESHKASTLTEWHGGVHTAYTACT
jgi:hypothetical protein